jgi:predicted AAA+ superfamily ATPase
MIERKIGKTLKNALKRQAAVALIGPRQVGKTTLALAIAQEGRATYLDLEDPDDRRKLDSPSLYLERLEDRLVILDEIHRMPELFQILRGVIDRGRRKGKKTGRFLILGSASIDLLRQSGESLAGRIAFIELPPLTIDEIGGGRENTQRLWLRGGFPDSFTASSDADSFDLRKDFIRTYLERDVPMFGPRVPAETLERLWTMLAHNQGALLNASNLARALSISVQTVTRYIDLLVDLMLVRRLQPYHSNVGKRLVKSPKTYVRDSGITHSLLGIRTLDALFGNPIVGASWEGFVLENLLSALPWRVQPFFYRTAAGAELDLVLEMPDGRRWAIEIKRGLAPKLDKGFHNACEDIGPDRAFVVYAGDERYPISDKVEAVSLAALIGELARIDDGRS